MNANEFDLDFDFEKEYGFDPPKDDDTKKLDTDFDLRAILESDFNQEAALFNSEYQNNFDYGPEESLLDEEAPADEGEPELFSPQREELDGEYLPEEEFQEELPLDQELPEELPEGAYDAAESEEEPAPEDDEAKPVRQRKPREPRQPSKLVSAVVAFFAPEEPKSQRPISPMRRFKNDTLPLIITGVTLIMILVFIFGAASRAIVNFRDNQEALKDSSEHAKTLDELEAEEVRILLAEAEELAAGYDYEAAIAKLEAFSGNKTKYPDIEIKLATYKQAMSTLINHNDPGAIPNLSFHVLIADPARAFTNSKFGGKYNMNFVTVEEFSRILDQLYANGFVLVEMESFIAETVTGDTITYSSKPIRLPDGKKPIMITETMVNYYGYMIDGDEDGTPDKDGAGFASRLVVDPLTGNITAQQVTSDGETDTGAFF